MSHDSNNGAQPEATGATSGMVSTADSAPQAAAAEPTRAPETSGPAAQPAGQATSSPWLQPLLVDLAELAVLLKISARTAKRMAAAGELPGLVRLGRLVRFDRRVIERWIADGCPKPTARRGGRR